MSELTQERVRQLFDYDPVTGSLTWKHGIDLRRAKAGAEAGTIDSAGRRYIGIDGKPRLAHRVIWLYVTGATPKGNIAAVNENILDLRFANLFEESLSETARRGGAKKANKSGYSGVYFDTKTNTWYAQITQDYKTTHLGNFKTKEEAVATRREAEVKHFRVPVSEREEKAAIAKLNVCQRRVWDTTKRDAGNATGWTTFDEFVGSVWSGHRPRHKVVVKDPNKILGPDNFQWVEKFKFDHRTAEGRKAYERQHRAENPMLYRDKEFQKNFGISLEDYQKMFVEQKGVCAICQQSEKASRNGTVRWLNVDHNHQTGNVRGLLCTNCNVSLGMLKDNTEILTKAIVYLHKWNCMPVELPNNVVPLKKA